MRSLGWPSAYVSRQSIVRCRISSRRARPSNEKCSLLVGILEVHYPAIPHCATTAFAVGATAGTVSVDCLAAQRHTVIPHVFSDGAAFQCFFAYLFLLSALRAGVFGAGYHGARLAGRTCGAPVGGALRAPLGGTWCRGSGVRLYSTVTYRAATAFAVDATAHAVFHGTPGRTSVVSSHVTPLNAC